LLGGHWAKLFAYGSFDYVRCIASDLKVIAPQVIFLALVELCRNQGGITLVVEGLFGICLIVVINCGSTLRTLVTIVKMV
jgi:hypothetical protein